MAEASSKPKKSKKHTWRISERMQKFLDGEITVEDLTDEEIQRGQFADYEGKFRGRPSQMIPRKFYDAVVAEQQRRWEARLAEELEPSLKVLKEIRDNRKAPADARMKSAIYIIERRVGKVPEKNEVKVQVAPWQKGIEGVLVDVPEEKAG